MQDPMRLKLVMLNQWRILYKQPTNSRLYLQENVCLPEIPVVFDLFLVHHLY
jgi:hypothetical protein